MLPAVTGPAGAVGGLPQPELDMARPYHVPWSVGAILLVLGHFYLTCILLSFYTAFRFTLNSSFTGIVFVPCVFCCFCFFLFIRISRTGLYINGHWQKGVLPSVAWDYVQEFCFVYLSGFVTFNST